jgi:hypothetical protein
MQTITEIVRLTEELVKAEQAAIKAKSAALKAYNAAGNPPAHALPENVLKLDRAVSEAIQNTNEVNTQLRASIRKEAYARESK